MGGRGRWPTVAGKINDGRTHGKNCRSTNPPCDCPERRAAHAEYMRQRRAEAKKLEQASQFGVLRGLPARTAASDASVASVENGPSLVDSDRSGLLRQAALREIEAIPGVEEGHPLLVASMLALADRIDAGFHPATQVAAVKLLAGLTADLRTTPEAVRLVSVPEPTQVQQLMAMLGSPL